MEPVTQTVQAKDPRVVIEYCTQCRWMLRAAWFAQELLTTFQDQIGEVALQPSSGGKFYVTLFVGGQATLLWDRKERGGFPESKELKQLVRNVIDPNRSLGHSDKPVNKNMSRAKNVVSATASEDGPVNTLDDKPMDNTTTEHAKKNETETLPDGPVSTLDDAPAGQPEGAGRKGRQEIQKEAKPLDCKDCE